MFIPRSFTSLDEWEAHRRWLLGQVRFAVGLWPEPARTPLNARISDSFEGPEYIIQRVSFESRPGLVVTGNLYRPSHPRGRCPAVLLPHGHWPHGRLHHDEVCSIISAGVTLARLGCVAFAYDMLGYNDAALLTPHIVDTPQRSLWGIGSMSLQTWNSIRAVDFLSGLPEVDPDRIGASGASGGGTQTFILAAVDRRVAAAAPVNMVSHTMQGGCPCENAPALRLDTNNMEIAACIAPRPMLLVSASGDWTADTPRVEYPAIRQVYDLYGAADMVSNAHFQADHNFNAASRLAVYRFFARHLLGRELPDDFAEKPFDPVPPERLRVFPDPAEPPDSQASAGQIIADMISRCRQELEGLDPASAADVRRLCEIFQGGLRHAVGMDLERAAAARTTPPQDLPPQNPPYAGLVHPGNAAVEAGQRLVSRGCEAVLGIRAAGLIRFAAGDARPSPDRPKIYIPVNGSAADPPDLPAYLEVLGSLPAAGDTGQRPAELIIVRCFGSSAGVPSPTSRPAADASTWPAAAGPATWTQPFGTVPKFFTTFNRTDTAEAVCDLLIALAATLGEGRDGAGRLSSEHPPPAPIVLVGTGNGGLVALLTSALIPEDFARAARLTVVVDLGGFNVDADEDYLRRAYVPCIRAIGGLRAALAVAAGTRLFVHNTGGEFPRLWLESVARTRGGSVHIETGPADPETISRWLSEVNR